MPLCIIVFLIDYCYVYNDIFSYAVIFVIHIITIKTVFVHIYYVILTIKFQPDAGNNSEMMDFLRREFDSLNRIIPVVCELSMNDANLWTPSVISGGRGNHYRKHLMKEMKHKKQALCMVTNKRGNGDQVICAHLIPCKAPQHKINRLSIHINQLNSSPNTVFWCKGIETMYETLQASFVQLNPLRDTLHLKLWTEEAKNTPIWKGSSVTLRKFDGAPLQLNGHCIWKRALSFQAFEAFIHSSEKGSASVGITTLFATPGKYDFYQKTARLMLKDFQKTLENETGADQDEEGLF